MTKESDFFLVDDTALSSDHQLHLRNSLLDYISRKEPINHKENSNHDN